MEIIINGEAEQVEDGLTVSQLLAVKGVEKPEMVAVELNSKMLKRSDFETTQIGPDDRVEFLYFMGGGAV